MTHSCHKRHYGVSYLSPGSRIARGTGQSASTLSNPAPHSPTLIKQPRSPTEEPRLLVTGLSEPPPHGLWSLSEIHDRGDDDSCRLCLVEDAVGELRVSIRR